MNCVGGGEGSGGGGELRLMALNDTKAGMEGLDVERINQIINESSRGSKFYLHKQQRQLQLDAKIQEMRNQADSLSPEEIHRAEKTVDQMAKEMEERREMSRVIVHIDMDAFFASVEMRDNPALSDKPMAVGGNSMLSTSNYMARRWGVRAAMPGFIAKKLCPQLIIVPPSFSKYSQASKEVEEVLMEYDKETLSMSMDEAYFDITDYMAERNSLLPEESQLTAEEIVQEVRQKIFEKTQLTASAGIAANGLLAKICGDMKKPNNQYFLEPTVSAIKEFMRVLPIRKVCGIGNVTEQMLKGLGVHSCGDIWEKRGLIHLLFKPATSSFLITVSLGIGNSFYSFFAKDNGPSEDRKSVSCETTFSATSDRETLMKICKDLSEELEQDIKSKGVSAKTITLKIKTHTFEVKTRARTIAEYTTSAAIIFQTAWAIYLSYEKEIENLKLRLMGVRVSKLNFKGEEDQSTSTNKQKTIDEMFAKIPEDTTERQFPCPVCDSNFSTMKEVNEHVDFCLSGEKTEDQGETAEAHHSAKETNASKPTVSCPICNAQLEFDDDSESDSKINSHIDICLNKSALKDIMQESSQSTGTSGKRPSDPLQKAGSSKRLKNDFVPIDSYFKPTT